MRAAALILTFHNRRKSRLRRRRSLVALPMLRSTASWASLKQLFRRPRNPSAAFRTLWCRRRRTTPVFTRMMILRNLRAFDGPSLSHVTVHSVKGNLTAIRKQPPDRPHIGLINILDRTQLPAALRRTPRRIVTFIGLAPFHASRFPASELAV